MYRIFIVEDDETIAKMVAKHLEKWDYEVWTVKDFSNVMTEFVDFDPQLILMDIRNVSKVPIIFLSSVADNMNIVMAVSMGADDFIAKPFDLEVLTVKIQALLRRSYDFAGSSSVIEHKGVMFQVNDGTITYNGVKLELTKNESKIMQTLLVNKEEIVTRDNLMTKLWESDSYVDENTLSVNVNRLRKKLAEIGLENFIITKKGIGYRIG